MAQLVKFRIREGVAIVTLANPRANAISAALRERLWAVLDKIEANDNVAAILLIAEGEMFSGGASLKDYDSEEAAPRLADICLRLEQSKVPVVAGLQGAVMGAGADLALACHHRLATSDMVIGFPEATFGLVPSGGATQRLPRLVGPETALDMLLSGRGLSSDLSSEANLIDGVVSGHLHTGAWLFAKSRIEGRNGPDPVSERRDGIADGPGYMQAISSRRTAASAGRLVAHRLIVDAVEAALLLPFETGLTFEADCAERARTHLQSAALRHVFTAERRIGKDLLQRIDGVWRIAEPEGEAVVSRLRHVFGAAAQALEQAGTPREYIDKALVDYGFARAPFGGRAGGAGPEGAALARQIVAAMMAEGARQLSAGAVARASDIDALCVHGLGFPRFKGGPMIAGRQFGLVGLRRDMSEWVEQSAIWAPPPILSEAIKTAAGFDGLGRV